MYSFGNGRVSHYRQHSNWVQLENLETYDKYMLELLKKLTMQWGIKEKDLEKTESSVKWDTFKVSFTSRAFVVLTRIACHTTIVFS